MSRRRPVDSVPTTIPEYNEPCSPGRTADGREERSPYPICESYLHTWLPVERDLDEIVEEKGQRWWESVLRNRGRSRSLGHFASYRAWLLRGIRFGDFRFRIFVISEGSSVTLLVCGLKKKNEGVAGANLGSFSGGNPRPAVHKPSTWARSRVRWRFFPGACPPFADVLYPSGAWP